MLAGPHNSHNPCLLSSSLFFSPILIFTKHHDLHVLRTLQRNFPILFRRPDTLGTLVIGLARPSNSLGQCQQ